MTEAASLPDPDQYPEADVVIYDGQCKFCTAQVQRLHRWDGKQRLAFLSLHDARINELCPDLTHDQLMEQMYVIRPDGRRYGGAAAARFLTGRLPRLWLLFPLLHIPFSLPIWSWLYRRIARRRYALGKIDGECEGNCEIHFPNKSD